LASLSTSIHIISQGDLVPKVDYQCPLMTLPLVFKTDLSSIPSFTSYLSADPSRISQWKQKLKSPHKSLKIGIAWAGSPTYHDDRYRSISACEWEVLHELTSVQFISLQRKHTEGFGATSPCLVDVNLDMTTEDFSSMAGLIMNLDFVITVDTAVAHLSCALGKETWILLPFANNYRWLLNRTDSPWYPSARLFRQSQPGDWCALMKHIRHELTVRLKLANT
jgi:hypothetical protein